VLDSLGITLRIFAKLNVEEHSLLLSLVNKTLQECQVFSIYWNIGFCTMQAMRMPLPIILCEVSDWLPAPYGKPPGASNMIGKSENI
jgi:hypothetical protein